MHILFCIVGGFLLFGLGYAFRGAIRRDLTLAGSEALSVAQRLENAARSSAAELHAEAKNIAAELRAKL